jgi:REP element-mobilizing transposase RayT
VTAVFVTWRLYGSLPPTPVPVSGEQFAAWDRLLDAAGTGPVWLRDPAIAEIVEGVLRTEGDVMGRFRLHAWVVMANHVHALVTPCVAVAEMARFVKGRSGRLANQVLGRKGRPFWQDESFVRPVSGAAEFRRIVGYIERNPVRAGLVLRPAEYPWSSLGRRGLATECAPGRCLHSFAEDRG